MRTPYSHRYYDSLQVDSVTSARSVVPLILGQMPVKSVVDVGCGAGYWTREYADTGCNVLGIDGDAVRESQLLFSKEHFLRHDLNQRLRLDRTFDLVHCVEVAEHLPEQRAESFVEDLCRLAPLVVFSAAIPGQGGTHHVNEQWPGYWIRLFQHQGFELCDCLRPQIWNMDTVAWWYRQNLLVFADPVRSPQSVLDRLRSGHRPPPHDLVHPQAWSKATAPEEMSPRMALLVLKAIPHFPRQIRDHFRRSRPHPQPPTHPPAP